MTNKRLCLWVFLFALSFPAYAYDYLEAYGDSITAGFMVKTDVTNAPPLKEMSGIISDLAMYIMTKNRSYVAKHHAPELAWPTVLASLIDPKSPPPVEIYAVSGAKTAALVDQVNSAKTKTGQGLAFFFIGHNDLCNNANDPATIASQYVSLVDKALEVWDQRHNGSVLYLVPIADIHRVYARLKGFVWHRGETNYTCEDSWSKFFPYCPSNLKKLQKGELDAYMQPRLEAMNGGLDTLALTWSKKSPKNRFVYLNGAHSIPYEPEYFAVDCFHPSVRGQQKIAQRLDQLMVVP